MNRKGGSDYKSQVTDNYENPNEKKREKKKRFLSVVRNLESMRMYRLEFFIEVV